MGVTLAKSFSREELLRLLDDVPTNTRWDIVQLALDLVGLVNPLADAASGFISLLRGDLIGAAISAVSIFPIGDVAKLAKFGRYRKAVEDLVGLASRNVRLARAIEVPMKQIDEAIAAIRGTMGSASNAAVTKFLDDLAAIRLHIARYMARMERIRMVDRFGVSRMARSLGRSGGQYAGTAGQQLARISVNDVVDVLEAAKSARTGSVKSKSKEILDMMALSEGWMVTAPVHRSASDATQHVTVMISGITGQFHLRLDKSGRLFDITHPTMFR
jgi:hypothetical protein